jgi:carbamoyl-phosphate synthase small subunit
VEIERSEPVAVLVLEDGVVFYGRPFGAVAALTHGHGHGHGHGRRGEVVFATSMTGYQEICTDPSYRGQMVCLTYPLIGNYGVAAADGESRRPWLAALLVRESCDEFSNWRAAESLDDYLTRNGIPGMSDFDTRALTRHLRTCGTLRGVLRAFPADSAPDEQQLAALVAEAKQVRSVSDLDVVGEVAGATVEPWMTSPPGFLSHEGSGGVGQSGRGRVLLIDTGFKHNIARCLAERGLEVTIAPPRLDERMLDELAPDGVLLSNGPGDPEAVAGLVDLTRALLRRQTPLMGICLGHQVLGLAIGARTSRLPFGHHGANHPVREVRTGRVSVTSQNHNFQVDAASVPSESSWYVSHVNLSDDSVEGLAHETLPAFSVQYHPEAAPGPQDNRELFDRFAQMIVRERARRLSERDGHEEAGLALVAG